MKSISLTESSILNACVEVDDGVKTITVVGVGVDGSGNFYPAQNMVLNWDDLPANVQNTGDNFFKHLSREFNKLVAAEDSETW